MIYIYIYMDCWGFLMSPPEKNNVKTPQNGYRMLQVLLQEYCRVPVSISRLGSRPRPISSKLQQSLKSSRRNARPAACSKAVPQVSSLDEDNNLAPLAVGEPGGDGRIIGESNGDRDRKGSIECYMHNRLCDPPKTQRA